MTGQALLWPLRYPRLVITLLVLATLVAAAGVARLQVDTSFDSLIPEDDPARADYQRIANEFGSDNRTLVYARAADLFSPDRLAQLATLQRELAGVAHVVRVDGPFNLRTLQNADGELHAGWVLPAVPDTQAQADKARALALANPLYRGTLFSTDGQVAALVVTLGEVEGNPAASEAVFDGIEARLSPLRDDFEALFQVGPPRISVEFTDSLFADMLVLGPLAALVLIIAILLFIRSPVAALLPILTSLLAIIWTFGMLGWAGIPLNMLSAMVPALIIVIGSTEDTHMMAAYLRGLGHGNPQAEVRPRAVRSMMRHVGLPLLLTILTTVLGFASNLLANITLIQQFAVAAAFAMLANGVITLALVPLLLAYWGPLQLPRGVGQGIVMLPQRLVELFQRGQSRHPGRILLLTGGICAFFGWQATHLYVTNDPLSYFPEDRPLIQDTRRIADDLAGVKVFYITLEGDREGTFLDPERLAEVAATQDWLATRGGFDSSLSVADHLAFLHGVMAQEQDALPPSRELAAQYLLFFHRAELEHYLSLDQRAANIVVRHSVDDSHTLNQRIHALEAFLDERLEPGLRVTVTGENLLINRAAERLMLDQIMALALLLLLVFLLMSALFTSFKGGAIALIPALIPIAVMFGTMGMLRIPLNPGTAMVAVIAVGIAIDGTIHLLARYNELCRRTSDYVGAVQRAVEEEATPLVVSSLALALGFGVLTLSSFSVVAQFGALAAATMLISVPANLFITPIVMARVRLVGLYQILAVTVNPEILRDSPLFAGMSQYQCRKAMLISEIQEFATDELLVEQGSTGRSMYLLLEGQARVIQRDEHGEETVIAVLGPGDVFGEMGYLEAVVRSADVRALTPVAALRFDYARMQQDLKFFPNIMARLNYNISRIISERAADDAAAGQ